MQVDNAGRGGPASSSRAGASRAKRSGPPPAHAVPVPVLLARTSHQMLVEQVIPLCPILHMACNPGEQLFWVIAAAVMLLKRVFEEEGLMFR